MTLACDAPAPELPALPPRTALEAAWLPGQVSPQLAHAVAQVDQQGGGAIMLRVVDGSVWNDLCARVDDLNPIERAVYKLAGHIMGQMAARSPDAPGFCACCGVRLEPRRYNLVVVLPSRPDPDAGLVMPVCVEHGATVQEVEAAAFAALRAIWPALRPFAVTHDLVGHA